MGLNLIQLHSSVLHLLSVFMQSRFFNHYHKVFIYFRRNMHFPIHVFFLFYSNVPNFITKFSTVPDTEPHLPLIIYLPWFLAFICFFFLNLYFYFLCLNIVFLIIYLDLSSILLLLLVHPSFNLPFIINLLCQPPTFLCNHFLTLSIFPYLSLIICSISVLVFLL